MALFQRTDWPGLSRTSRTIPLRLLRIPRTAMRSAIGVTPSFCPGPMFARWARAPFACSAPCS